MAGLFFFIVYSNPGWPDHLLETYANHFEVHDDSTRLISNSEPESDDDLGHDKAGRDMRQCLKDLKHRMDFSIISTAFSLE